MTELQVINIIALLCHPTTLLKISLFLVFKQACLSVYRLFRWGKLSLPSDSGLTIKHFTSSLFIVAFQVHKSLFNNPLEKNF